MACILMIMHMYSAFQWNLFWDSEEEFSLLKWDLKIILKIIVIYVILMLYSENSITNSACIAKISIFVQIS